MPEWLTSLDVRAAAAIDAALEAVARALAPLLTGVTAGLRAFLAGFEALLLAVPGPLLALAIVIAAWRAAGLRLAGFAVLALAYLGGFGFWASAMSTLSLVATAVAICFGLGLPIGILSARSERLWAFVRPVLDVMQTMPSFVYLVPAIALFSIGKPPAVLATVIFCAAANDPPDPLRAGQTSPRTSRRRLWRSGRPPDSCC